MGQKVNPFGFRLGSLYTWKSRWFASKNDYKKLLIQDVKLREYLMNHLQSAGVVNIEIERSIKKIKIFIHVSRPGVVIGRGGSNLEILNTEIKKRLGIDPGDKKALKVDIRVEEVQSPETQAQLVAQHLSEQLQRRYPHRRAISFALQKAMDAGAKGIKIQLSGRIAGAEISRTEKYFLGNIPTQTIRADINYAELPSLTRSGYVGIKVWIYKGEKKIQ
jgi:small subunit ribosomal protein S3